MSPFRSLVTRIPLKVLVGWLVASMVGWLGVALLCLGIEREIYRVPLTAMQVIAVVGGMEGTALALALSILAIFVLVGRAEAAQGNAPKTRRAVAWKTPLSTGGHPVVASALPRWRATVLQ